jgi:hypothetical protein
MKVKMTKSAHPMEQMTPMVEKTLKARWMVEKTQKEHAKQSVKESAPRS